MSYLCKANMWYLRGLEISIAELHHGIAHQLFYFRLIYQTGKRNQFIFIKIFIKQSMFFCRAADGV